VGGELEVGEGGGHGVAFRGGGVCGGFRGISEVEGRKLGMRSLGFEYTITLKSRSYLGHYIGKARLYPTLESLKAGLRHSERLFILMSILHAQCKDTRGAKYRGP
jgi:hypothetical protein